MRKREHERRVCEAMVRVIAHRRGEHFEIVGVPDELERSKRAIDLHFRGRSGDYVMEHTQIESFPEQITDDHRFVDLLRPVVAELTDTLPKPGKYVLTVLPGAVVGAMDDHIPKAFVAWVREKAPTLQLGSPLTAPDHEITKIPPGVPFPVTLRRWPGLDGTFHIARSVPENLEEQRTARIGRALEDKCPKLLTARGENRISVLVLESNDLALADYAHIARAVISECRRRHDIPDEILLVHTDLDPWEVWILREDTRWGPDHIHSGPYWVDAKSGSILTPAQ